MVAAVETRWIGVFSKHQRRRRRRRRRSHKLAVFVKVRL
jgi:hypothetical protein